MKAKNSKCTITNAESTYEADNSRSLADANNEILHRELVLGRVRPVYVEKHRQHPLKLSLVGEHVRQHCNLRHATHPHVYNTSKIRTK